MNKRIAVVLVSLIMIISLSVIIVEITPVVKAPTTWYVDDVAGSSGPGDPEENFTSIQDAIDNATDGDTVFVYNGTYNEYLVINKTINLTGEDKENTSIEGSIFFKELIKVTADWVNISGFRIGGLYHLGGVYLLNSNFSKIYNNHISANAQFGIKLEGSSFNNISGNNLSDDGIGIHLKSSTNNTIEDNNIFDNYDGIRLYESSNDNIVINNNFSINENAGIHLDESSYNNFTHNSFLYDGFFIEGSQISHFNSHKISTDNLINGKSIYYIKNSSGIDLIGISTGQIILANSSNINLKNLEINNTAVGIEVAFSSNINIDSNTILNSSYGIHVCSSEKINITDNNITSYTIKAIYLHKSTNNTIANNDIVGNYIGLNSDGIYVSYSSNNNSISYNNVTSNGRVGIYIYQSSDNEIIGNNISANDNEGMYLSLSSNNTVSQNRFENDGLFIKGWNINHYNTHSISIDNTVKGKSIYYYKDDGGFIIDGIDCGQIIIVNCTNIDLKNLHINHTDTAVEVAYCSNVTIKWNNFSYNTECGIYLAISSYNIISNNYLINNEGVGIILETSSSNTIINNVLHTKRGLRVWNLRSMQTNNNNLIACNQLNCEWRAIDFQYSTFGSIIGNNISSISGIGMSPYLSSNTQIHHNNFFCVASEMHYVNFWDNGYPSGGNYWDDYNGIDLNSTPAQDVPPPDGIGDMPYVIDADSQDNYPLMEPIGECMFLFEGWNLISLPFIQSNTTRSSVLSPIDGYYDSVQLYNVTDKNDLWKVYKEGKPYGNDLFKLNEKMGFWIHIIEPVGVLFEYPGIQPSQNQTISLFSGWNLVGFPSLTIKNRTEALNNLTFGVDIDSIWTYNSISFRWEELGPSDYFEPGRGYWIHAKSKCEWEVPL